MGAQGARATTRGHARLDVGVIAWHGNVVPINNRPLARRLWVPLRLAFTSPLSVCRYCHGC